MRSEAEYLHRSVAAIRGHGVEAPTVALVLGSGLRRFAERLERRFDIPFEQVEPWSETSVEGHGGSLVIGEHGGMAVACLTGRVHLYEGATPHEVVRAVRTLRVWGVERFLLSNAAGGIADGLLAGDLMVIEDHLNLTGCSALVGEHEEILGKRFPDQTRVYDSELRATLAGCDPDLKQGVYAGLLGPSYETPAEVAMLKRLGASAVGMSTVLEATALHAMGAKVCGVSLISNLAAGISDSPLSHDEVIAAGRAAESRLAALLQNFLQAISR